MSTLTRTGDLPRLSEPARPRRTPLRRRLHPSYLMRLPGEGSGRTFEATLPCCRDKHRKTLKLAPKERFTRERRRHHRSPPQPTARTQPSKWHRLPGERPSVRHTSEAHRLSACLREGSHRPDEGSRHIQARHWRCDPARWDEPTSLGSLSRRESTGQFVQGRTTCRR